ncbi:uncharacterized protein LOC131146309 isoform X2 [Malania oleifera]|uniref:uncharacterized protein LOC131146309 isoform X2 n=1 Tax=Malania oleifera TaxID=397392 RepID=UPI0025AE5E37|nr:uncharacterized protein LOC131146309 isoform X2 [Malania oleifera]
MPGNEVGDRIHNFFDQENLSQGQHHSQVVEGNWPVLSNNLWVGNQRQVGAPLSSYPKNYIFQQSDSERGHDNQSVRGSHGLNYSQLTVRPEFSRSQSQNQQPNLNGFMHGHQVLQTRQNEGNFLGVDTESDRHYLTSRGMLMLESQQGNGPDHNKKNSRLENSESPVNFDFLGGQPQMSGQQPNMLQMPRQQSGFSDIQLLQQQVVFKQMQEFHRQQQLQQLEARQQNSQLSSITKQATGKLVNGAPVHDASNYPWSPEVIAGNSNWIQRGASPAMQGSSSGLVFSTEQSQAQRFMGLVSQQVDHQSLYGVPISSTRGASSQYSHMQIDKPPMQQISTCGNSFPGNQFAVFQNQLNMQDGAVVSRQGCQGKNFFENALVQGLNTGVMLDSSLQGGAHESNAPAQEFHGRQGLANPSEISQAKTVMQVASSQSLPTLDPTEQKILFGTDDNTWDAFGRNANNMLNGTDLFNTFTTVQSGTWSALMQSAVAESASSDMSLQEEWTGPNFQNAEPPMDNHQPLAFNDRGKQQTIWAEKNLQTASSMGSRPLSDDANKSTNLASVQKDQQSGPKFSHEQGEKLQASTSHGSFHQSSEVGGKWSDHSPLQKPLAEASQTFGNAIQSSDADLNAKSMSSPWTHQQGISPYKSSGQLCNKSNGWNFIESVLPSSDAALKIQENVNLLQHQRNDQKRVGHEEMGCTSRIWRADSVSNSNVELEHVNSSMENPQINREDSSLNNVAAVPDSCTSQVNQETNQHRPNSHHLDSWRNVDSSVKCRGNEDLGKCQHHLNRSLQVLGSSSDKGSVEMHEVDENYDKKENSSDSYRSNLSHHTNTSGTRENVWLDANDSHCLPGGKQKSSGHCRKNSGARKFQYHPMGNLDMDVELSYGAKLTTHSQAFPQQVSRGSKSLDQGYFGQSQFVGHVPKNSMEKEKGQLPDFQRDMKGLDEVPSRGILTGCAPNTSASFDRAVGIYTPSRIAHSSQNMLDLLQKVDQSRECGNVAHFSNQSSEMPDAESSDGSIGHLQRNLSSTSQGFGLQLGPPSQRLTIPNHAPSSQTSACAVNSLSSNQASPDLGVLGHTWLTSAASVQTLPPPEASQGELGNRQMQGNFAAANVSGFPYSRSQLQNQHNIVGNELMKTNQSVNVSFEGIVSGFKQRDDSHDRALSGQSASASLPALISSSVAELGEPSSNNQAHVEVSGQQNPVLEAGPVSQPSITSGVSQRGAASAMLPNAWKSVSSQQQLLGVQSLKDPSNMFPSHIQSDHNSEMNFSTKKLDDEDTCRGQNGPSEPGAFSMNSRRIVHREEKPSKESTWKQVSSENIDLTHRTMSASQVKESVKHFPDAFHTNPATTTQRDIEAFGRSLKPNNILHQNYSLLHQVQAMKGMEVDPSNRGLKRFKGQEVGPEAPQVASKVGQQLLYGYDAGIADASGNRSPVPSGDSKMLSFSSEPGDNQDKTASSQHVLGTIHSRDVLAFARTDSQNHSSNNNTTVRTELSQISPQMAPSWFDQYGTFKNRQILPTYDVHGNVNVKNVEEQLNVGKSSVGVHTHNSMEPLSGTADTSLASSIQQKSTPIPVGTEHFSFSPSVPQHIADQSLVVMRPKKRKSTTSGFTAWHKEVMQGSQRLHDMSIAETDWAQATNRLKEKMEDEPEVTEDGPPMLRPKRRLVLTTQLMQQLLRPPLASVFSVDASSNYESVVYFVSRLALGDACGLTSCSTTNIPMSLTSANLITEKLKTSERIGDQYFSQVMEDLIGRSRKLEKDLLGLDKRASMLDLRLECQDLEKFSIINRFAKFHGRGQADGAETSFSDATANSQKSCLQRYVTALPMPRNLPDRICTTFLR